MKWLVALCALLFACRHEPPASRATGSAGSAVAPAADPWAATGPAPDDPPSLAERHRRADAICPAVTGPYFFSITKGGKTSYLLGTRHIGVALAKFPPVVLDTIHHAPRVVFEIAPDDRSHVDASSISIPDALGPDLWHHYEDLAGKNLAAMLEHAPPSRAMLMLIAMYEDTGHELEAEIQHEVEPAHTPMSGLETAAFQDGVIEKLMDVRMLKAAVKGTKDRAEIEADMKKDLGEYCAGTDDSPGLDEKNKQDMRDVGYTDAELAAIDDTLVFSRNRSWIPKLEALFEQPGTFVAVGADHLIGDKGVVALLRARGFTVTRITK